MSFKNYKRGLKQPQDQAIEFSRTIMGSKPIPASKSFYNPWWNRQKHPGWAAYHANKEPKA